MAILVSNATDAALTVWIEPWCDELELPVRGVLTLKAPAGSGDVAELEGVDNRLVVWAMAPGTLVVSINGVEQDTGSRTIALPAEMLSLPVKRFVSLAFENQPRARPAGAPSPRRFSGLWFRV